LSAIATAVISNVYNGGSIFVFNSGLDRQNSHFFVKKLCKLWQFHPPESSLFFLKNTRIAAVSTATIATFFLKKIK
jgi:hypothetical protein